MVDGSYLWLFLKERISELKRFLKNFVKTLLCVNSTVHAEIVLHGIFTDFFYWCQDYLLSFLESVFSLYIRCHRLEAIKWDQFCPVLLTLMPLLLLLLFYCWSCYSSSLLIILYNSCIALTGRIEGLMFLCVFYLCWYFVSDESHHKCIFVFFV